MNKTFWLDRYTKLKKNGIVGLMSYNDEFQHRVDAYFNSIKQHIKRPKCSVILDYGCGTAKYAKLLKEFFGGSYTGYDIIDFVIEDNKKKLPGYKFTDKQTGIPKKVDVIWLASLMQHMDDLEISKVMKKFHSIISTNGKVYVTDCLLERENDAYTYFRNLNQHIKIFEKAGFKVNLLHVDSDVGLFECRR